MGIQWDMRKSSRWAKGGGKGERGWVVLGERFRERDRERGREGEEVDDIGQRGWRSG